ncbi:TENS4 protein, partial [Psilopogon haemacephalus]|nr:TENS4 protein [Psilopogon haemacephalus]
MSQVLQNHVLRVGQTVRVPGQESILRPAGYLPSRCLCCSGERWASSPCRLPSGTQLRPGASLRTAPPAPADPCPPQREEEEESGTDLLSPTLDISIESLNQLILEIDPSFQPLRCQPPGAQAQPAAEGDAAAARKADPEAIDIKYIEMTAGSANCAQLPQGSPSTSCSRCPQGSTSPAQPGVLRGPCSAGASLVFSSPPGPASPRPGTTTVPQLCPAGQTDSICYSSSPGPESLLKPVQVVRAQQRGSWVSMLSTSPGSDTSYVLGSSFHSLHNDDSDAHPAACPSPAGCLGSPCPPSPSITSHSGEAFGPSPQQPGATCSPRANACPAQKGQASSCPPSILTCTADIPVLLLNGCLQQAGEACRLPSKPPASAQQPSPSCSPALRLGALNSALSAPALSCLSEGPLRAGQPSMKFVMDTSKYWFKPNITREQAIQLLRDKEPGTFVVRDSTSYRGSFGLAMKLWCLPLPRVPPAGDESGDLVRHFLIESSARGVHLRGASEELYFGSLSAFVYQHATTPLALPCKLNIPTTDLAGGDSPECALEPRLAPLKQAAVCNVLYLSSVNVETLTGAPAVQKAISSTFELETLPTPTLVHFRVTEQGITLTDIQRKLFFRRHYPLAALRFCGMDPENRKIFGFVAKSQTDSQNLCHLFAEYDSLQPAAPVIDLLCKLLPGP